VIGCSWLAQGRRHRPCGKRQSRDGLFTWPRIRGLPHNIQISTANGPYDIQETICAPVTFLPNLVVQGRDRCHGIISASGTTGRSLAKFADRREKGGHMANDSQHADCVSSTPTCNNIFPGQGRIHLGKFARKWGREVRLPHIWLQRPDQHIEFRGPCPGSGQANTRCSRYPQGEQIEFERPARAPEPCPGYDWRGPLVGRIEVPGLDRRLERPLDHPCGIRTQIQSLPIQEQGLGQGVTRCVIAKFRR
jgi:hypothetical protein